MKRLLFSLALIAFVAVRAAEPVEIKLATILPLNTSGHQGLMEMRDAWHKAAPQAVIALEERFSGEIVQALREGATDVGVIMEGTPMEGLQWCHYRTDQLVAVVPKKHPLRSRTAVYSSLLDHEFVGLESATALTRLLTDQAAVVRKPLRARIQVHSFAALCKMIEAGLGIGVLPQGAARPFATAMQLRLIRLSDPWATRRMYVCYRDYDALPAIARKLVDHLQRAPDAPRK